MDMLKQEMALHKRQKTASENIWQNCPIQAKYPQKKRNQMVRDVTAIYSVGWIYTISRLKNIELILI